MTPYHIQVPVAVKRMNREPLYAPLTLSSWRSIASSFSQILCSFGRLKALSEQVHHHDCDQAATRSAQSAVADLQPLAKAVGLFEA